MTLDAVSFGALSTRPDLARARTRAFCSVVWPLQFSAVPSGTAKRCRPVPALEINVRERLCTYSSVCTYSVCRRRRRRRACIRDRVNEALDSSDRWRFVFLFSPFSKLYWILFNLFSFFFFVTTDPQRSFTLLFSNVNSLLHVDRLSQNVDLISDERTF